MFVDVDRLIYFYVLDETLCFVGTFSPFAVSFSHFHRTILLQHLHFLYFYAKKNTPPARCRLRRRQCAISVAGIGNEVPSPRPLLPATFWSRYGSLVSRIFNRSRRNQRHRCFAAVPTPPSLLSESETDP